MKKTNKILEDHGAWLLIDISTPTHPNAKMAVDKDVWDWREGGRLWAVKGVTSKYIYAKHMVGGKFKLFHHQVIKKVSGLEIDHKEHPEMTFIDNRRSNLRNVTPSHNNMNRGILSNNKSGITGVRWSKGKWNARIVVKGKFKHLGSFDNIKEATTARKAAEREYFGEHAFNANN